MRAVPVKAATAFAAAVSCLVVVLLSDGVATSQDAATPRVPLLFVGQGQPNQTEIYNMQNRLVGYVPVGEGGSAFDPQGAFYHSPNNGDELSIFLPPYKQVSTRIRLSAQILNVAVDQRTWIFAVTLYDGSAGEVQFFRHGYQGPCNTVVASGVGVLGTGSAFDHEGRLFIEDVENNGYETVASITGECKATTVEVYQFPFADIKPQYPFTFTAQDNLVFEDGSTQNILTFAHPLNGRFANPLVTTTLTPTGPKPMGLECLIGDGKHLWAAELPPGSTPQLTEYRYPQGGAPIATISLVHPYTCAAFPPIIP